MVFIGGVDLRTVGRDSLRSASPSCRRKGFLFTGTIADNIRYGRPGSERCRVAAAFHELDLEDWLAQMPAGNPHPVGERGSSLSAGERQLVALVRAWLSNPDLLVLDEATSAVDPALDVSLRRAIDRLIEWPHIGDHCPPPRYRRGGRRRSSSSTVVVSSNTAATVTCSPLAAHTPASTPTGRRERWSEPGTRLRHQAPEAGIRLQKRPSGIQASGTSRNSTSPPSRPPRSAAYSETVRYATRIR